MALTALVFDLVGLGRCMEVPDRPGGALKPLAIAAFSLVAAQFGLGLFSGVLQAVGAARAGVVFGVLGNVAGLAQFFCFLFFLRGTAGAVRQANLAAVLLIHTLAWVGFAGLFLVDLAIGFLTVGPSIFPGLGPPDAGPPAGVPAAGGALLFAAASCLTGVAALGMAVWYILIVHQVRDAVDRSLRRP